MLTPNDDDDDEMPPDEPQVLLLVLSDGVTYDDPDRCRLVAVTPQELAGIKAGDTDTLRSLFDDGIPLPMLLTHLKNDKT